ncbi:MAG: sigma-70 family RNA polymerase sigma factor [Fimbriimonadales bacterium]
MIGRREPDSAETETALLREVMARVALKCASEREQELLANWLVETCLYYAHVLQASDPQEIAVVATERLWDSILAGKFTWQEDSGRSGLLSYVRQAVQFEIGHARRSAARDRAAVVSIDEAIQVPDPYDVETAVVEQLTWNTLTDAVRDAISRLSPQQQQVVQLRMEGLEPREIAQTLNIPRAQVNVVLSQAYARLRKHILQQARHDKALAETLLQVFNIQLTEASNDG